MDTQDGRQLRTRRRRERPCPLSTERSKNTDTKEHDSPPAGRQRAKAVYAAEWQLSVLKKLWEDASHPSAAQKQLASVETGLDVKWISAWFQRHNNPNRKGSYASLAALNPEGMKAVEPVSSREGSAPEHATPCLSESSQTSSALATSHYHQGDGHWLASGEPIDSHTVYPVSLRSPFGDHQVRQDIFLQHPSMLSGPGGHSSARHGPSVPYIFSSMQDSASLYTPTGSESSMLADATQPSCSTLVSRDSTRSPALPLLYKFSDGPTTRLMGPGRSATNSSESQSQSVAEIQDQRQFQQLPRISHILVNSDGFHSHRECSSSLLPPLALDQRQDNTSDLEPLATRAHNSHGTLGPSGYCFPEQASHTPYNDPPASLPGPEGHDSNLSALSQSMHLTSYDTSHDATRHPPPPISFVCRYKDMNDLVHRLRQTYQENILEAANRSRAPSDQSETSFKRSEVATVSFPTGEEDKENVPPHPHPVPAPHLRASSGPLLRHRSRTEIDPTDAGPRDPSGGTSSSWGDRARSQAPRPVGTSDSEHADTAGCLFPAAGAGVQRQLPGGSRTEV
ncbi:hypothetical protein EVG20_g2041 [Dentipellis fragilis]|uniref:Homeobox domain-containing protein n=1 Tax=Dentipellis fragilis TaxID=205917 RepID=A0A4Y9ZAX2_9AGAM|nr:hypothetical protein EVG20_g2041 [Dentipellis fragilis]